MFGKSTRRNRNRKHGDRQRTEFTTNAFADFITKMDEVITRQIIFRLRQSRNLSKTYYWKLLEDDLKGHFVKLKTVTADIFNIADSGSPITFLNEKTAQRIQQNDRTSIFKNMPPEDTGRNLACYNGETINPKGRLVITIESGGWKV